MTRPFAVLGISAFAVMVLLCAAGIGVALPLLILSTVLLTVSLFVKRSREKRVLPAVLAAGVASCIVFIAGYYIRLRPAVEYDGKEASFSCVITEEGENKNGKWYYPAETEIINGKEQKLKIRLCFSTKQNIEPFDKVEGDFHIYRLSSGATVFYKDASSGAAIGAYPLKESCRINAVIGTEKPLMYKIIKLRQKLKAGLSKTVAGDEGALACAFLLGKSSDFPQSLGRTFNRIGVSHMICVSGLHLSVWALLVLKVLRRFRLNIRAAAVLSAMFVIFFMALTGFTYSINRAGIMMLIYLFAVFLSDSADGLNSLGISACVILFTDPFAASNAGFLLSFLSTLGILTVTPHTSEYVRKKIEGINRKTVKGLVSGVSDTLCATLAALIFTLPVMLLFFGGVNFISLLGNLLILPAASAAMISAGVTAILSIAPVLFPFRFVPGIICSALCRYVIAAAGFLSRFDSFLFYPDKRISVIFLVALTLAAAVLLALGKRIKRPRKTAAICFFACFSAFVVCSAVFSHFVTRLTVINCGDNVSVLINGRGSTALLGCGDGGYESRINISQAIENTRADSLGLLYVPDSCNADTVARIIPVERAVTAGNRDDYIFGSACQPLSGGSFELPIKGGEAEYAENGSTLLLTVDGVKALVCFDENTDLSLLPPGFRDAAFAVSRENYAGWECITPGKKNITVDIFNGKYYIHEEESFFG